jgi:glutaconate CoA-transferase subunit A
MPLRNYHGTDLPRVNTQIRPVTCPFTGENLYAVPAIRSDVTIIHSQRADENGNAQVWGLMGAQKEAAFAGKRVIVVAEEIVDEETIRSDPNRTLIPGLIVSGVVHEPWGAHPSYVQGYYDRDNRFYVEWDGIARSEKSMRGYLDEWVYGVSGRSEYMEKLGEERKVKLRPEPLSTPPVNYGLYR